MPDDLRAQIADLRRLRDAASPLPWIENEHLRGYVDVPGRCDTFDGPVYGSIVVALQTDQQDMDGRTWYGGGSMEANRGYLVTAANIAPALADAYDAALATIAERDAEIARLRAALKPFAGAHDLATACREIGASWTRPARDDFAVAVMYSELCVAADALKGANRDE